MTRARNNMRAVERVGIEFQIRFLASSSLCSLVYRVEMPELGKWRLRELRLLFSSRKCTRCSAQMRLRSIHSPRKILRFAEKLGNFGAAMVVMGGILFGQRGADLFGGIGSRPRVPETVPFRAHI